MPKKMKVRFGADGYNYPYTHENLIFNDDNIPLSQKLEEITNSVGELDELTKENLQKLEELILKRTDSENEPAGDDMPRIYFSGDMLPTTKDYRTLKMKYSSKTKEFECYVQIKCQGTSSMAYDKKNFSIKTYEDEGVSQKLKLDFKGWGEQYKFVLKANYIDLSHARNVVSAKLWGDCVKARSNFDELPEELKEAPNLGAIDGFFVKVYHEGVYQGRYTFNIPKDPWMTNMDEDNENHNLLCAENYGSGCFQAPALIDETDWTNEIHKVTPPHIFERWNEIIEFVRFSTDEDFRNNLHNYFDVESLIDYYCFQDLICGLDSMGKNQIYITYDGMKWLATAYDMDSTWGLYWDGQYIVNTAYRMQKDYETGVNGTVNLLYDRLEKHFKQEIYDRYKVLRKGPMSLTNVVDKFESFASVCTTELINEDFDQFPWIPGKEFNNIKQIRQFAVDRFNYCDDRFDAMLVDSVDNAMLYELAEQTRFNGDKHIDTGIKLFDTAKDWTMILYGRTDEMQYQWPNAAIVHCMYEGDDGNYPGLCLQFLQGDNAFFVMSEGNIFPNNPINSTFKMAIVCRNGIITELKKIDSFGTETYKRGRGAYVPVQKNLIIGSYLGESNNFERHWNGEMYYLAVYDGALSGGEVNFILDNLAAPNMVLKDNYSPNKNTFVDTVDITWEAQEIYASMNLDSCDSDGQNVLSIGLGIENWAGNNIHFYYTKNTGRMLVQCMIGGAAQNIDLSGINGGQFTVKFNSEGLTINDTLYRTEDYAAFEPILASKVVKIGSTEGTGRSSATNYRIEVRNK
jgi:hypothetical protein